MARSLVVVGNGMVGHRLVQAVRDRDGEGAWRVTVLAEEPRPAYDRVALTSYVDTWDPGRLELDGADFAGALRTETPLGPEHLPPYVEVVKPGGAVPGAGRDLARQSVELLRMHLRRRPAQNPFRRYAKPLVEDLRWLSGESLPQFHRYAFATLRQFGAAFELAGACLRWLEGQEPQHLQPAARSCESIAGTAKALQFKIARAVQTHRAFDPTPALEAMAAEWDEIMSALTLRYGSLAHVQ